MPRKPCSKKEQREDLTNFHGSPLVFSGKKPTKYSGLQTYSKFFEKEKLELQGLCVRPRRREFFSKQKKSGVKR